MDVLTAARAPDVRFDVDLLLELTAPKAYYLVTSMPPLVSTHGNRERSVVPYRRLTPPGLNEG
jgi:hypothetical protein